MRRTTVTNTLSLSTGATMLAGSFHAAHGNNHSHDAPVATPERADKSHLLSADLPSFPLLSGDKYHPPRHDEHDAGPDGRSQIGLPLRKYRSYRGSTSDWRRKPNRPHRAAIRLFLSASSPPHLFSRSSARMPAAIATTATAFGRENALMKEDERQYDRKGRYWTYRLAPLC